MMYENKDEKTVTGDTYQAGAQDDRRLGNQPELQPGLQPELQPGLQEDPDAPVFLMNVPDDLNAGMLETMLKESGIPVMRKYPEAGSGKRWDGNSVMICTIIT